MTDPCNIDFIVFDGLAKLIEYYNSHPTVPVAHTEPTPADTARVTRFVDAHIDPYSPERGRGSTPPPIRRASRIVPPSRIREMICPCLV